MCDLDIYDPPVASIPEQSKPVGLIRGTLAKVPSITNVRSAIRAEVQPRVDFVTEKPRKVLKAITLFVSPVTRFIPVDYDTVKRVTVIGICTLSGVLQGRHRGGFRRYTMPVVGYMAGSAACYPKQTYQTTVKLATTSLPLIATAGRATAEATSVIGHQGSKVGSFIYSKAKEQFPEKPVKSVEEASVLVEPGALESVQFVAEQVEVIVAEPIIDLVVEDNSAAAEPVLESTLPESVLEPVLESVLPESILESALLESVLEPDSSDKIICLELLEVPSEVEEISGNLGMGDTEHNDMYSTRSARP